MRLEISETIPTPNPETVLRALEAYSRDVSGEVIRLGHQLTLRGLGPSPSSKNLHDTTVLSVSTQNNATVIHGEANFQASALLGSASQHDVVRSKLDRIFDKVKTQLDLESMMQAKPPAQPEPPAPQMFAQPISVPTPAPHAVIPFVTTIPTETIPIAPEPEPTPPPVEQLQPSTIAPYITEQQWLLSPKRQPDPAIEEEDLSTGKPWGQWLAGFAIAILLTAAAFFFTRHDRITQRSITSTPAATHTPVPQPPPAPAATTTQPAPATTTTAATISPAPPAPVATPVTTQPLPDPKVWLHSWADAMQTRDAAAQAAFYADKIDFYMGQHDVGRDAVQRDRAATINIRKGLWTMTPEDVEVLDQTPTQATIRLTKHFTHDPQDGSQPMEWSVPAELILKPVDGTWKISSERDLSTPTPPARDLVTLNRHRR
jgi:ketosteroid isomerase-like protein